MLVQIPVFIGLLNVIRGYAAGTLETSAIYSFLTPSVGTYANISSINQHFLGINLFANNNIILLVLGCICIYAQTRLTSMLQ
jgi:membrane protein insertase Oxa1/YidC/SpoIIIJ